MKKAISFILVLLLCVSATAQSNYSTLTGAKLLYNYFIDFISGGTVGTSNYSAQTGQKKFQDQFIDFLKWADSVNTGLTSLQISDLTVTDTAYIDTLIANWAKITKLGGNIDANQKTITNLGALKTDSVTSNSGNLKLSGYGSGIVEITDTLEVGTLIADTTVVKTTITKLDLKNQTALDSTIGTDTTRIYPYDDGSSVRLVVTKDDNATEATAFLVENTTNLNPLISNLHKGRRQIFAGNNGLGQSAQVFATPVQSDEIAGTRTSDIVFTRTAGEWTEDALIGQYAFSYAEGTPSAGTWLPIIDNDTTTLTISGTLHATGTAVRTCPWKPISALYAHGQGGSAYIGGVFDGQSIWFVPYNSANLTKVNPATGAMTHYAHDQGSAAYEGGVFDGQNIWLVPYNSANLTKVNPATGAMTHYAHEQVASAYAGGVFDGQSIWLVPFKSANLTKVNPATGAMTHYAHEQGSYAYAGGVFDGQSLWLVPSSSTKLTKVNPATGAMTHYAHDQGSAAYFGGLFDGQSIWLVPFKSANLTKVNPATGAMTHYAHEQVTDTYAGGIFDGQSLWLVPYNSANLTKVNPATGAMTHYAHGQGGSAYFGGIFDGQSIWLVPYSPSNLTKVTPPEFGLEKYPNLDDYTTGNFETDIASGEANKDIDVPVNCSINSITLKNTLSSGDITNFQAILDPTPGDNDTLISGKIVANGKTGVFKTIADHYTNSTVKTLRFNATGNGAGGIEIIVTFYRRD